MGFFSRLLKKDGEHVLLINIGSASVMGAFVSASETLSTVTASVTVEMTARADIDLPGFESEMQKALTSVLASLASLRAKSPDRITVYFAAPWYASQVRTAKMSRPNPFVVSKTLVEDMISRELKAFEAEELASGRNTDQALRPIESKTVQVKLNGYASNDPLGLSVRELELAIFLSVAPERTLARIEEIIARQYRRPAKFSSFLSASFIVARDFFPHIEDYLLIDVGGEVTDVTLVRESSIVQSLSFPLARNFILRKLSSSLGRSIKESLALCTLYVEEKLEPSVRDQCASALSEAKDAWLDGFQKTLFSISNELSIPDTILLSVGADIAPWFIETIRREKFNQYSLTEKEFKVIVLDAEMFSDALAFAENVPRNPFIMIEALAAARELLSKNPR